MFLIERILGNVRDPAWRARTFGATVDRLHLDQWEAQKNRLRKTTEGGIELALSLERHVYLHDGDVLLFDESTKRVVVAALDLSEVMVVDLSELEDQSPSAIISVAVELGHALGNQHWPAVVKGTRVFVPLAVDRKVMASVMKTHALPRVRYAFVPGADVLPFLAPHEARRLFGGAENAAADSHAHAER